MLISQAGQQRLTELRTKGELPALDKLVKNQDVGGLVAKGLSKLDALALIDEAKDRGIDAAFAKFGAAQAISGVGDGTTAGMQAVAKSTNKVPAKNHSAMQRIELLSKHATKTGVTDSKANDEAIRSLTRTFGARVELELGGGLTTANLQLTPQQLEQALTRLLDLAKNPGALEAALGEKGWSLQPRSEKPNVLKTTYYEGAGAHAGSAVRVRQSSGGRARIDFKPGALKAGTEGIRQRIEFGISLKPTSQVDLGALLGSIADKAPSLKPAVELEEALSRFTLQHEDGRSSVIDLETQRTQAGGGKDATRRDSLELSGPGDLTTWPALLKALL